MRKGIYSSSKAWLSSFLPERTALDRVSGKALLIAMKCYQRGSIAWPAVHRHNDYTDAKHVYRHVRNARRFAG